MRAVIFANGELNDAAGVKALIRAEDMILAADGGARLCAAVGVQPDVVVGDMDSINPDLLNEYEAQGVEILRYEVDKDETDLELALLHALDMGVSEALVLGGLGQRWDQTVANLLLPAYEKLQGLQVVFWDAGQRLYVVRDAVMIEGEAGMTVSLIPIGGAVMGVRTEGLAWPLKGETLAFGATRGVSNTMQGEQAKVTIEGGVLLVIVGSLQ